MIEVTWKTTRKGRTIGFARHEGKTIKINPHWLERGDERKMGMTIEDAFDIAMFALEEGDTRTILAYVPGTKTYWVINPKGQRQDVELISQVRLNPGRTFAMNAKQNNNNLMELVEG